MCMATLTQSLLTTAVNLHFYWNRFDVPLPFLAEGLPLLPAHLHHQLHPDSPPHRGQAKEHVLDNNCVACVSKEIGANLKSKQVTEKALSKKCKNQSCRDALPAKNTSPKTNETSDNAHRKACTDYPHITARCIYRVPTIPTSFQPHPSNDIYVRWE